MGFKCRNCGFRSTDAEFFRRERGGVFNWRKTVCDGCTPYRPTPYERRQSVQALIAPLPFLLPILGDLDKSPERSAFLLIMLATSFPTLPVCILIHEAGHAFAARLTGKIVSEARIGSGPVRRRLRIGDVIFEIRAYPWMGGLVKFFSPSEQSSRAAEAFIIAAGPFANIAAAVVAFGLSYFFQTLGVVAAALAGFGIFNMFIAIYNLVPRSAGDIESVPSDGRQLLDTLKPRAKADPVWRQVQRLSGYGHMGRYDEAVAAARDDWQRSPLKFFIASLIQHNLSRGQGERAALAFYFTHEDAFQVRDDLNSDDRASLAWVWANAAWSAIKLDDPGLAELAGRMAAAAIATVPDRPETEGTYGAWLVSTGRAKEGLPLLLRAVRTIHNPVDKADFCTFLARGWRREGNERRAAQYDALRAHLLVTP